MFKDEVINEMAMKMLDKYDKYWGVVHEIMDVDSILDPRYKMSLVEFYFEQVFGKEEAPKYVDKIRALLNNLLKSYKSDNISNTKNVKDSEEQTIIKSKLDYDDSALLSFIQSKKKAKVIVMTELDHYLENDVLPWSDNFDILT